MKKRASVTRLACANKTIEALNEMEETLRRLGLRGDAGTSASKSFLDGETQDYVAAIRKTKEDAARLRREKEYRQFVTEEQERESAAMSVYVSKEMRLREVINQGLLLFEQERISAHKAFSKNIQKSTDKFISAREQSKKKALQDCLQQSAKWLSCSESFVDQQSAGKTINDVDIRAQKKQLKAQATQEYCHTIAVGIIDVAMRVAEHTYTIGAVNNDKVICLPQDISLSTWNAWVNELVFSKTVPKPMSDILASNSLRELCDSNFKNSKSQKCDPSPSLKTTSDLVCNDVLENGGEATSIDNQSFFSSSGAEHLVRRIIEMQQNYGNDLISSSVTDAIRLVKFYEKNKYRFRLDSIRRQNDSESPEEVVPGWTHRLPPAGCFVYGDELSGLKAFTDMVCSDSSLPTLNKRHNCHGFSLDTLKSLESECSKWDLGSYHVLTPQMLVRTPLSGCTGQTGGNSGGGGYSAFSQRTFNKTGGMSLANTTRGRECKQNEELVESKQYIDALCDQLTKELIAVYQHNLQLLMRSETCVTGSKETRQMSLRTLFLVGFPETGFFWRTLYQKLHIAVEIVEQETNKALMAEEAGEELPNGHLNNKTKSNRKIFGKTAADEALSRKKNRRTSPGVTGGKKGVGRSFVVPTEEETPLPRARVYPPLCLCGIFLQYDVTSRYKRMREGNCHKDLFSTESTVHKATLVEEDDELFSEQCLQGLRHELIQQDKKMRNLWKIWGTTVSRASVAQDFEAGVSQPHERVKKRSRVFVSRKVSEPTVVNTQSCTTNQQNMFPKILFFRRKEDITASVKVADFLEFISTCFKAILNPSVWSVAKNADLVPGQLAAPLKLSDYRFLPSVRLQMVELERRFQQRWNKMFKIKKNVLAALSEAPSQQLQESLQMRLSLESSPFLVLCASSSVHNDERKLLAENTVWLEIEMHRVFRIFFLDLVQFMNVSVFPSSLWGTQQRSVNHIEPNTNSGVETFSRTTHFFAVDNNYSESRERLSMLFDNGISKLTSISATLLQCVLNLALTSIGEALVRICYWASDHFCAIPVVSGVTETNTALPATTMDTATDAATNYSGTTAPILKEEKTEEQEGLITEGNSSSCKKSLLSDFVMKSFLATVPRLSFEDIQAMVTQLDGRVASFKQFQQVLWSYGSRVHQTALNCLLKFIEDMCTDVCTETIESFLAMAPHITEIFVAYLFAFLPPDKMVTKAPYSSETVNSNFVSEFCSSVISVPIGRTVAAIRVLRRCCMVAGLCSARWIDYMYANALQISPLGFFPAECRPTDIVDIFSPPDIPEQEGGASPPSLAFRLLASKFPAFTLSAEEERSCWWETEMEVFLQNFSIYQKPVIDKNEFLHCILQTELLRIWRFLPIKTYPVFEQLSVSSFPLNYSKEQSQGGSMSFSLPYFGDKKHILNDESSLLTEEEALQLFWDVVRDQQKCLSNQLSFNDTCKDNLLASFSADAVAVGFNSAKPLISLREFFLSFILRRTCASGSGCGVSFWSHGEAVQEPSTMELRMMVRSLPRAVKDQYFSGNPLTTAEVTLEDWKRIKWWRFFDDSQHARLANFIQRYMLRLLTVCFAFSNGEMCSRSAPLLSEVLYMVTKTRGCRATVERYFHAISALGFLHEKRSRSQTSCFVESEGALHKEASSVISDVPLMVFDLFLSVDDILFFFQRNGETGFCKSCPKGFGDGLLGHLCKPRSLFPILLKGDEEEEEKKVDNSEKYNKDDDDDVLPLATELALLQQVENCSSITLTLLGASHWGKFIIPQLTTISL